MATDWELQVNAFAPVLPEQDTLALDLFDIEFQL